MVLVHSGAYWRAWCNRATASLPFNFEASSLFCVSSVVSTNVHPHTQLVSISNIPSGSAAYGSSSGRLSLQFETRKPAIKKPARHQWFYCAKDYDPMEQPPSQPLPPYAPEKAQRKDYRKIFHETMPQFKRNRHRRMWAKGQLLADHAWKHAAERAGAKQRRWEAAVNAEVQRRLRAEAWQEWCSKRNAAEAGSLSPASSNQQLEQQQPTAE